MPGFADSSPATEVGHRCGSNSSFTVRTPSTNHPLIFAPRTSPNSTAVHQIGRMIKEMPYISEHLSSLRQEIADLRNLNARISEKGAHSAVDQTALELRTNRLREIKQELSKILNRPDDPKVWWERSRRPQQQA